MYEFLVTVLSSAVVSTALSGALVWFLQSWISERVKNAIKYEYDSKLETHKAQLKAVCDAEVEAHKAKLAAQNAAATERLKADLQIAHLREQQKTDFMAEETVRHFLSHKTHIERSFETLKKHLGGFTDDELRKILVRAGAFRTFREDGSEWWKLLSRMSEWLERVKDKEETKDERQEFEEDGGTG